LRQKLQQNPIGTLFGVVAVVERLTEWRFSATLGAQSFS
jgi:hypothetical protein